MPLKFATETLLIVVLGFVTILTGVVLATLPALPAGLVPGIVVLLLTLVYAFSYTGLFRRDRAEYAFRLLHLFPAAMVLGWFALQGMAYVTPSFDRYASLYTWGWSLAPVAVGFLLLLFFCLSVVRLWGTRLFFLLLLLVPFVALGVWSRTGEAGWEQRLASTLWQGTWWNIAGSGATRLPGGRPIAYVPSSALAFPSSVPSSAEVAWSSAVAQVESRSSSSQAGIPFVNGWYTTSDGTITNRPTSSSSQPPLPEGVGFFGSASSIATLPPVPDTGPVIAVPPATPKPPIKKPLAHSGPFTEVFAGLMLAGYTTAVHGRAKRRMKMA